MEHKEISMRARIETERVDLFDVNMMITMNVRINREVPFDALSAAFEKACKVHEVLNSRIVIEASGEAFYVENDAPQNSFSKTTLGLAELIGENEKRRFRLEDGEFLRGFLSPDGLVFMMHHLGGDGKSLVYFIETFMRCLVGEENSMTCLAGEEPFTERPAGEECAQVPFRNLTLENLPAKSKLPFFYEPLIKSWNRKWQKEKKIFGFREMEEAYAKFWKDHQTEVSFERYEENEISYLLTRAKESGVSLTAWLITNMIKDSGKTMDIGLAVDGRMDQNRSMGNQATGISVQYKYQKGKSFEANAKAVHGLMQKKLSDDRYRFFVLQFMGKLDDTLKDALNLEHAGCFHGKMSAKLAQLLGYGDKVRDLSITNLTRADIPLQYGDYGIQEIIFIPPVVSYAKNVIGIVTAGDVMYVARHVYR